MSSLSDGLTQECFEKLCGTRKTYPDSADIWELRLRWKEEREHLENMIFSGEFRFGIRTRVTLSSGRKTEITDARDALAESGPGLA